MRRFLPSVLFLCMPSLAWGGDVPTAEIVDVRRIWDKAQHNAFTDLIRYRGRWYCGFREGESHVSLDGSLRLIASDDGETWESVALLTSATTDLRDTKLCVTADGRLMMTAASAIRGEDIFRHQTLAWFSSYGETWTQPVEIGDPDIWLWRVTWHKRKAYGFGYGTLEDNRSIRLYTSTTGEKFDTLVENAFDDGYPNETAMVFMPDDTCYCLLRRDEEKDTAQLGIATPPYTDWNWRELGVNIGGPNMIRLPDGRLIAAVRLYRRARTSLCYLDVEAGTLTEFLKFPSGGDTSYAGMAWHDGLLWVSYYSTHEAPENSKASIYLARVRFD